MRSAVDQLQGYAPDGNRLIVATDQEGGWVQHLLGPGFDRMPSATDQGTMTADQLRQSAGVWGSQLAAAGKVTQSAIRVMTLKITMGLA